MTKNLVILLLLSLSLAAFARLFECRKDIKEAGRKSNRDYEFVDIVVGCTCGEQLLLEQPYHENAFWPVVFTCQKCNARYVLSKTLFKDRVDG